MGNVLCKLFPAYLDYECHPNRHAKNNEKLFLCHTYFGPPVLTCVLQTNIPIGIKCVHKTHFPCDLNHEVSTEQQRELFNSVVHFSDASQRMKTCSCIHQELR